MNKDILKYSDDAWDKETVLAAMEKNDCVVRAIAASFSITYTDAHTFVQDYFQRQSKKGTRMVYLKMRALREKFGKSVVEMGIVLPGDTMKSMCYKHKWKSGGKDKYVQFTTASFIKTYPKGTYFIMVSGHAFCIKDGVVHGNPEDATKLKTKIKQAFKIG